MKIQRGILTRYAASGKRGISIGSDKSCTLHESIVQGGSRGHARALGFGRAKLFDALSRERALEKRINAVKRSAVSTGQLKPLLVLHTRPIDPVVFREPML